MENNENLEIEIHKVEDEDEDEESNEKKSEELKSNSNVSNDDDNKNNIHINDSLKLYDNQDDKKSNHFLGSEEIFINQKKEIQKLKKRNELLYLKKESKSNSLANTKNNFHNANKSNDINEEVIKINIVDSEENQKDQDKDKEQPLNSCDNMSNDNFCDVQTFSLNDYRNFEYIIRNNEDKFVEDKSYILDVLGDNNNEWNSLNEECPIIFEEKKEDNSEKKYFQIEQAAIRVIQEIDYDERGLELNIKFDLLEQSELLIFTRCFVNKDINESYLFDAKSENIDFNENFNKYTSLIKIIKDSRCFITFGTFYHEINENNKLYYKSFLKRQLIDFPENDNNISNYNSYIEEKKTEFNMFITDLGEELINVQISLNNNKKFNIVNGNFFLPINKKAKILICGRGKSVVLKELEAKTFDKRKSDLKMTIKFESENETPKNCECCIIT